MSKFSNLINFKPQTMMMAGSCAAALMAGLIILPNIDELGVEGISPPVVSVEAAAEKVAPESADEIVVTTSRSDTEPPKSPPAKTSVDKLLDEIRKNAANSEAESNDREKAFQDSLKGMSEAERETALKERADAAVREYRALLQQKDNIELFVQQDIFTESERAEVEALEAAGVEGRQLDEAIQKVERSEKRKLEVQKELSTIESQIRQFQQKRSRSSAKPPAPAPELLPAPPPPAITAVVPQPGFVSPPTQNPRLNAVRAQNSGGNSRRTRTNIPGTAQTASALPKKIDGLTVEEIPGASGRVNTNTVGQFTVFNGVSNQVVQSTQTTVNQTGEILARVVIPAKYKTVTKQVLVSPAKSEEITIPAVTKDITVKRSNGDGTFRDEIETIVVEEERIDYVLSLIHI